MSDSSLAPDSGPWWRHGLVWMVLAGPAVVVVAGFVTLWIAITNPDPVLTEDYYRKGLELSRAQSGSEVQMTPAMRARNHATTGGVPQAAPKPAP